MTGGLAAIDVAIKQIELIGGCHKGRSVGFTGVDQLAAEHTQDTGRGAAADISHRITLGAGNLNGAGELIVSILSSCVKLTVADVELITDVQERLAGGRLSSTGQSIAVQVQIDLGVACRTALTYVQIVIYRQIIGQIVVTCSQCVSASCRNILLCKICIQILPGRADDGAGVVNSISAGAVVTAAVACSMDTIVLLHGDNAVSCIISAHIDVLLGAILQNKLVNSTGRYTGNSNTIGIQGVHSNVLGAQELAVHIHHIAGACISILNSIQSAVNIECALVLIDISAVAGSSAAGDGAAVQVYSTFSNVQVAAAVGSALISSTAGNAAAVHIKCTLAAKGHITAHIGRAAGNGAAVPNNDRTDVFGSNVAGNVGIVQIEHGSRLCLIRIVVIAVAVYVAGRVTGNGKQTIIRTGVIGGRCEVAAVDLQAGACVDVDHGSGSVSAAVDGAAKGPAAVSCLLTGAVSNGQRRTFIQVAQCTAAGSSNSMTVQTDRHSLGRAKSMINSLAVCILHCGCRTEGCVAGHRKIGVQVVVTCRKLTEVGSLGSQACRSQSFRNGSPGDGLTDVITYTGSVTVTHAVLMCSGLSSLFCGYGKCAEANGHAQNQQKSKNRFLHFISS